MEVGVLGDGGGVGFAGVGGLVDAGVILAMDVGAFDRDLVEACAFALNAGVLDRERKLRIIVAAMEGGVLDLERNNSAGVLALEGEVFNDERCSPDFFDASGECFDESGDFAGV